MNKIETKEHTKRLFKRLMPILITVIVFIFAIALIKNRWNNFIDRKFEQIFSRKEKLLNRDRFVKTMSMVSLSINRPAVAWLKEKTLHSSWQLNSRDRLKLEALYIPSKNPSNKLVILAHGYCGSPEDLSEIAKSYYENFNYHVLIPTLRGHDKSEGKCVTFGYYDGVDINDWCSKAINLLGEDTQIVLHGFSMGGAAAIMSTKFSSPPQVKAIISDSSYSSLEDELKYILDKYLPYKSINKYILNSINKKTKNTLGFELKDSSPKNAILSTKHPILLLHSYDDKIVPISMAYEMAADSNLYSTNRVKTKFFSSVGHAQAFLQFKTEYLSTLFSFLNELNLLD